MKLGYFAALTFFLVGLAVGALVIWFILPLPVTIATQGGGPLPGPLVSATPSGGDIVAGLDKCQPLLDDCGAYHDCVKREVGAAIAEGLPDCPEVAAAIPQTAADVTLCFSPPVPADGCDPLAAMIHSIDDAERTILLQTYVLTSQTAVDALLRAHGRRVAVGLIVDKQMLQEQPQLVLSLVQTGFSIRVDASVRGMARSSVMIIDGTRVLAGSFDFTNEAERWNADDLLIIGDRALVARYQENWNFHLAHSEPVRLSAAPGAVSSPAPAPRRSRKRSKPSTPPAAGTKSAPER